MNANVENDLESMASDGAGNAAGGTGDTGPAAHDGTGDAAATADTSRRTWLIAGVTAGAVLVVAVFALLSGGRFAGPADARAAVTATATASVPAIGTLMSSTDPAAQVDRLGAFAAETPADTTGDAGGTEGPAGADGAPGVDGAEGPPGADGAVGATGPAGFGLTVSDVPTQSVSIWSPDGLSYRIVVRNDGIFLQGPTTTQVWSDTSHLQVSTR